MKPQKDRIRKPRLSLAPRSHTHLLLASGIVLAAVVGLILVVFIVSPLVTAACDLIGGFLARICDAVGPV